jgi:hypothetical protein
MSKMSLHDPFSYFKHKLWPKERLGDSQPLKVKNRPNLLVWRQSATYRWKVLDKGYNSTLDLTSNEGLHTKLWASKVVRVSILGISRLPLESPRTKWHLGASPMAMHKEYYKGEGGGFPQVRALVSLVSLYLPVPCSGTKNVSSMH